MPRPSILLFTIVGGLVLFSTTGPTEGWAQPDSVRAEILKEKGFSPDHSPRNALWRAAAVPGWGQLYNRQYLKLPFVYAGFAAIGVRVYRAHQRYKLFQRAHLYGIQEQQVQSGERETNEYQRYEGQFQEVRDFVGARPESNQWRLQELRSQRDRFRRKRDLSILGTGLFYALTMLDAYVSAHLLTFDVGEELSVRVHPTGSATSFGAAASGVDVRLRLRF
jgi:hypothetical protein